MFLTMLKISSTKLFRLGQAYKPGLARTGKGRMYQRELCRSFVMCLFTYLWVFGCFILTTMFRNCMFLNVSVHNCVCVWKVVLILQNWISPHVHQDSTTLPISLSCYDFGGYTFKVILWCTTTNWSRIWKLIILRCQWSSLGCETTSVSSRHNFHS